MQVGVLIRNRPGYSRHTHPLAFETIRGINEGLQSVGYVLSIIRVGDVIEAAESRVFQEHVLDGMVVIDAMPEVVVDEINQRVPRTVWVDSNVWRASCCVRRNERDAGRLAAEALLKMGYRKWVWAGLGAGPERNYSLTERYAGVHAVAAEHGIEIVDIAIASGKAVELGFDSLIEHLRPDIGIITYGVYQARSIQSLAACLNLSAPYAFGLVCCDDSHDIRRMWPGLSRATFDRFEMGYEAAQMMLRLFDGTEPKNIPSVTLEAAWQPGNTAWGPTHFVNVSSPLSRFTSTHSGEGK